MGFWKDWFEFVKGNAALHMKRISISIGAFLFLLITSISLGWDLFVVVAYAGAVETSGIILMTLFGKNGNGNNYGKLDGGGGSSVAAAVDPSPNNH